MMTDLTPTEFAYNAALKVEEGWCQHNNEDFDGNVCLLGAMGKVAQIGESWHSYDVVKKAIVDRLELSHPVAFIKYLNTYSEELISRFNDAPDRTQVEVADFLKLLAKDLIDVE